MITASDLMTAEPISLKASDTVGHAAGVFTRERIGAAPVIDDLGAPVGLFTREHLVEVIAKSLPFSLVVKELMLTPVITLNAGTPVENILSQDPRNDIPLVPITDADGRLVGVVTRRHLHRTLRTEWEKNHDKLNALLEFSYNAIIAVDAEGIVTTWNPATERMTGIPTEKALDRPLKTLLPDGKLHEVLVTGKSSLGQKVLLGDTPAISNRTPIIKDGKILGAVAVLQDISSLESVAAELEVTKELNKELDAIIDSVYEGIYITDGDANTLRINKAYTRMTGIRPGEVLGKNMKMLVEKGIYSESVTLHVLEKKEPVTILHQIKGNQKCLITGSPIFNDNKEVIRVVTTVRDVTELNKLEKKLAAAKSISVKYHQELQHLRRQQMRQTDLVEHSAAMKQVLALAHRAAQVDATVLISGETGAGKEMVAKFIHKNSPRHKAPFINVNCAAIPESLLESELFGYEKGAFTGAQNTGKPGLFELADTGTFFLDEIGDLPHGLQAKLLRVLQDKAVIRIGGTKSKQLDVRILAASNQHLEQLVKEGGFRQDLFYRLNVIPVSIPPLRERREEIPYLAKHFLDMYNERHHQKKQLSDSAIEVLMNHEWPGNVRELRNLMERLVVIGNKDLITRDQIFGLEAVAPDGALPVLPAGGRVRLREAVAEIEKQLIQKALSEKGSTRKAARWLGVSQPTIIRKAKRYGVQAEADS